MTPVAWPRCAFLREPKVDNKCTRERYSKDGAGGAAGMDSTVGAVVDALGGRKS